MNALVTLGVMAGFEVRCPTCPHCGVEPSEGGLQLAMISGGTQTFCPSEECDVIMWNVTEAGGGQPSHLVEHHEPDGRITWRPASD